MKARRTPTAGSITKSLGAGARLCHLGNLLMENRNGFIVATVVTPPTGNAECEAAVHLASALPGEHRKTLGGDKGFDTEDCVMDLRQLGVTPHFAQNDPRRQSALDARTTRHRGYLVSLRLRKLIETRFGWMKVIGTMRKTKHRGTHRVDEQFRLNAAAFNLLHLANLLREPSVGCSYRIGAFEK